MVDRPISLGSWGRKVVSQGRAPFHRIQVKGNALRLARVLKTLSILDHTICSYRDTIYARSKIFQFLFFFSFYRLSKRIIDPTNFRSTGFSKVTLPKIRERRFHVRRCYLLRSESFPSVERDVQWNNGGKRKGSDFLEAHSYLRG